MQGKILVKEMNIFIYRLSLINSWALVIFEEIFYNSRQVYGQLDDWIVDAVA
jgi:cbb3-type cytochrome oxidase subunit 1